MAKGRYLPSVKAPNLIHNFDRFWLANQIFLFDDLMRLFQVGLPVMVFEHVLREPFLHQDHVRSLGITAALLIHKVSDTAFFMLVNVLGEGDEDLLELTEGRNCQYGQIDEESGGRNALVAACLGVGKGCRPR